MPNWLTRAFRVDTPAGLPTDDVATRSDDALMSMGSSSWTHASALSGARGSFDPIQEGLSQWRSSALAVRCIQIQTGMLAERRLDILAADKTSATGVHLIRERFNNDWANGLSALTNRSIFWGRMERFGEAHILMDRGEYATGPVRSMQVVMGRIERKISAATAEHPHGQLTKWIVTDKDGRRHDYLPSQVLWLRYPDPEKYWGCIAPLSAALTDIAIQYAARIWQSAQFRGGSAQKMIDLAGAPPEVADAVRYELDALASGASNAGRVILSTSAPDSGGIKAIDLGMTAQDLAWLDGMGLTNDQILHAFNMPRDLLIGGSTYENQTVAKVRLWTENLIPKLAIVASEIDRVFYPTDALSAAFPVDDIIELRADDDKAADAKIQRLQKAAYADMMTVDEIRAAQGLPPMPDGMGGLTRTNYNAWQQASIAHQFAPVAPGERIIQVTQVEHRAIEPALLALPSETRAAQAAIPAARVSKDIERYTGVGQREMVAFAKTRAAEIKNRIKRKAKRTAEDGTIHVRIDPSDPLAGLWHEDEEIRLASAAMRSWMEAAALGGVDRTTEALSAGGYEIGDPFKSGEVPPEVAKALEGRIADTAKIISATTAKNLLAAISDGLANGEGSDELGKRVDTLLDWSDQGNGRGELIARDNVLGAYHEGQHLAVENSSLSDDKVTRRWQSAGDDRVRPSHQALDGQEVHGLNERFSNHALFPGDREAGAAESLQCRCVVEYHFEEADS